MGIMKKNRAGRFIFTLIIVCLASCGMATNFGNNALHAADSTDGFEALLGAKPSDIGTAGTLPLPVPVPEAVPVAIPSDEKNEKSIHVGDKVVVASKDKEGATNMRSAKVKELFTNDTAAVNYYNRYGITEINVSIEYLKDMGKSVESIGGFSVGDKVVVASKDKEGATNMRSAKVKVLYTNDTAAVNYYNRYGIMETNVSIEYLKDMGKSAKSTGAFSVGRN